MTKRRRSLFVPVAAFAVGAVLLGIDAYQGAPPLAVILGLAVVILYGGLIWVFQTSNETVAVMAGRPSDERWQLVHERALGLSATIGSVTAVAGFAGFALAGRDPTGFIAMAVALGLSYLGGLVWFGRRL